MCQSKAQIDGRVVIITGANTGIGKETALELALRGAKVIMACRDVEKGERAAQEISAHANHAKITVKKLDLSSLESVRKFAKEINEQETHIDMLINNAGVMMCPQWKTHDGFEMQIGTNHLGHFLLTLLLLNMIKKSSYARVINVASIAHIRGYIHFNDLNMDTNYTPANAYAQSKLANILFSRELAKRVKDTPIKVYCLHPGIIATELTRHYTGLLAFLSNLLGNVFQINAQMGAQTTLYCALEDAVTNESGQYYSNCTRVPEKSLVRNARDDAVARKLWDMSCDLVRVEDKSMRLECN